MKAIVVGAGVSGLATAIRLAAKGHQVEVFEKEARAGGRMGLVEGEGYRFDLGPTIVMMPDVYRDVFRAAGRNPDDYIPMQQVEPLYNLRFADGETHAVHTDLVKLTSLLESVGEEDAKGYFRYLADIYGRYLIAKNHFIDRSFHGPLEFFGPRSLVNVLRLKTFDSAWDMVSRYVKDDRLRKLLSFQTLYIGIAPRKGPSLYTIIPMIEMMYGVWFLKGGMYAMVEAMLRLAGELGVKVHCSAPVEEILTERRGGKPRAVGVRVGGREIRSDVVACTADFPWALKNLLKDRKARGAYSDAKIDRMEYSCSCYLLYLGLDKKLPELELHNISFARDFEGNIKDIFSGKLPDDPSMYFYCPSKYDQSLAPPGGEALYVLVPVPNAKGGAGLYSPESAARFRALVMDKMRAMPGLADVERHIVFESSFSPSDFASTFNAYNGATFGLAPTLLQSNYFRPHNTSSSCSGLYFAGSSVHPGAGVPIVLTSAKLAAQDILEGR